MSVYHADSEKSTGLQNKVPNPPLIHLIDLFSPNKQPLSCCCVLGAVLESVRWEEEKIHWWQSMLILYLF